jgi:undecaprenyl-diphosphatase
MKCRHQVYPLSRPGYAAISQHRQHDRHGRLRFQSTPDPLLAQPIREATLVRRRSVPWLLLAVAVTAMAVFAVLTVAVTRTASLAFDTGAFETADDLRAPWLDTAAKLVTKFGLIALVGSAVLLGALLLLRRRHALRAAALVVGAALAWISVWITKSVVDRPRPPNPLVHTSGQSYPSAHAANSVGWLALAIALSIVIPNRTARIAATTAGALLAALVGLSRIYLRAHYASDVIAGEALAVTMYALAAIGAITWRARRDSAPSAHAIPSSPPP